MSGGGGLLGCVWAAFASADGGGGGGRSTAGGGAGAGSIGRPRGGGGAVCLPGSSGRGCCCECRKAASMSALGVPYFFLEAVMTCRRLSAALLGSSSSGKGTDRLKS